MSGGIWDAAGTTGCASIGATEGGATAGSGAWVSGASRAGALAWLGGAAAPVSITSVHLPPPQLPTTRPPAGTVSPEGTDVMRNGSEPRSIRAVNLALNWSHDGVCAWPVPGANRAATTSASASAGRWGIRCVAITGHCVKAAGIPSPTAAPEHCVAIRRWQPRSTLSLASLCRKRQPGPALMAKQRCYPTGSQSSVCSFSGGVSAGLLRHNSIGGTSRRTVPEAGSQSR